MLVVTAEDVRNLDVQAKDLGIPGILLMEHAAMALKKHVDAQPSVNGCKRVKIVCGIGNNGGDGFALARLLQNDPQIEVELLCAHSLEDIHGDAQVFARIASQLQIPWFQEKDVQAIENRLANCDILVDCLFGTGLNRDIEGWDAILIELINSHDLYVVAADIPSGIEANQGTILGTAIRANATITFACGTLGLFVNEGISHSGHVELGDIELPKQAFENLNGITILEDDVMNALLPNRNPHGHKGSFGKGLIIGGALGMSGASVMVAHGALRCGIGTITTMVPQASLPIVASQCYEMMTMIIPMVDGNVDKKVLKDIIQAYDVIAFGNGMGRSEITEAILDVLWESDRPCIFDGDALYYLKKRTGKTRNAKTILTPHPKEVSYLLGISTRECMKNLSETLKTLKEAYKNSAIVMKDANTLIFDQNDAYLNLHGNDGLATGGSGDVLCGMILGFLAQKATPIGAASAAVYLHARCAEDVAKHSSTHAILPRDLIEQLPKTLFEIINKKKSGT